MDGANRTRRRKASPEPERPSNSGNNATYGDASQFVLIQRRKSPRLNPPRPPDPSLPLSPTPEASYPLPPPAQNKDHTVQLPPTPTPDPSLPLSPTPEASHPLPPPAQNKQHPVQLPPPPNPSPPLSPTPEASHHLPPPAQNKEHPAQLPPPPNPSPPLSPIPEASHPLPPPAQNKEHPAQLPPPPNPSPPLSPIPEASHPLPPPAQNKEHPAQLPPPPPPPPNPSQSRNNKKTVKASMNQTRRRSARLNTSVVEPPPNPSELIEQEVPAPKLPTLSEASSSRARLWFGPGPPPPLRAQSGPSPQPHTASDDRTQADTAAAQTGSSTRPHTAPSPWDSYESPQLSQDWPSWGPADKSRPEGKHNSPQEPLGTEQFMSPDPSAEAASTPVEYSDDGSIRCRLRLSLRSVPEAYQACGRELDVSAAQASAGKKKRKRNKGKSDVVCGRGLGKPRDPVQPADRPKLKVVGDAEFASVPDCTKVITTIRVLTLENLPGPYRSYNMFPSQTRLVILQQFMQRYSWGAKERIGRCIDVFEKIAAEAYQRELNETRARFTHNFGDDKELWKEFPPKWCKNIEYWKGLCDVWSTHTWSKQSATNHDNRTKNCKDILFHVTGSRSMFRHKQALKKEKGDSVGLKDVFDRTHMHKKLGSMEYVNQRAKDAAEKFVSLKGGYGDMMEEEKIWERAVNGEDKRGRLYGFGFRGRTSKSTRVLETVEASPSGPTRSTATSAADTNRNFTKEEVAQILAAERTTFANDFLAQERRHQAEREALQRNNKYTEARFAKLFEAFGMSPPPFNEETSESNADGGHNGSEANPNPSEGNSGGGEDPQP